jgi:hypothetical protein
VSGVEEVRSLQINIKKLNHLLKIKLFFIVQLKGFYRKFDSHCQFGATGAKDNLCVLINDATFDDALV